MDTYYSTNAIKIQSFYKGFYVRKKLIIFYKLPYVLQRKILWHLNKDIYHRHFNCSLAKLIYKRYENFYNNSYNNFIIKNKKIHLYSDKVLQEKEIQHQEFRNELNHIIKLTIKYDVIINIKKIRKYSIDIRNYLIRCCMLNTLYHPEYYQFLLKYCAIIYKKINNTFINNNTI